MLAGGELVRVWASVRRCTPHALFLFNEADSETPATQKVTLLSADFHAAARRSRPPQRDANFVSVASNLGCGSTMTSSKRVWLTLELARCS